MIQCGPYMKLTEKGKCVFNKDMLYLSFEPVMFIAILAILALISIKLIKRKQNGGKSGVSKKEKVEEKVIKEQDKEQVIENNVKDQPMKDDLPAKEQEAKEGNSESKKSGEEK